jgi:hypothetical protein
VYVRIARFEGSDENWDERIEEVRQRIAGGDGPMQEVRGSVKRAMMLVDREGGHGASVIFCDSREDAQKIDQAMNQMNPAPGGGSRSSVEIYEVAIDEQPS